MEEGKKITWILFIVTGIGVLLALSQYIFPWQRFFVSNIRNVPVIQKSVPQPIVSLTPVVKQVPDIFYTQAQVAGHTTVDNCWFILKGQVYDVSQFIRMYKQIPNISQICGTDITGGIGGALKQYGLKDISQLTTALNQYAIGKVK